MKRSEAWSRLYQLACDGEDDEWLDNPMCVANNFLKLVEDLGMLPPFNYHDFMMDGDKADEKSITYRTWEPEREEE